jgi:hypothetical protein
MVERSLRERLEEAVIEEMRHRLGGETAEAWELIDLQGPFTIANRDSNLGSHQVRYQARFFDTFAATSVDISVNYDPDTGLFGIIKFASGRAPMP